MSGWEEGANKMYALQHTPFGLDCARGAIMVAMQGLAREHEAAISNLILFVDPMSIRSKAIFAKGDLTLVCCSTKVSPKKSTGAVEVVALDHAGQVLKFFISPQNNPTDNDVFVAPFWYVPKGEDKEAKLKLTSVAVTVGSFSVHIPVLQNTKKVNRNDMLQQVVPDGSVKRQRKE